MTKPVLNAGVRWSPTPTYGTKGSIDAPIGIVTLLRRGRKMHENLSKESGLIDVARWWFRHYPSDIFVSGEVAEIRKQFACIIVRRHGIRMRNLSRGVRAYQLRFDKLTVRAGITRKLNPHMMRHTCATMQLDRNIDMKTVSENLGHSSMEITEIYLHLDIRRRRAKYQDGMRGII